MAGRQPEVEPDRRADARPEPDLEPDLEPEERPATGGGWLRRLFLLLVAGGLVIVLVVGIGLVSGWPSWLPQIGNPFQEETTDRSQPVLLESIQDLSRFTAASGNFEVVIDVETNRRFIPDIIVGERTLFVAAGSVDAYVEFSGLTEGALVVDEANNSVAITLPAAQLEQVTIDHERSYVFAEERGVVNRIGDFFGDDPNRLQEVLLLAETRIAEAAELSGLRERAAENTQNMLVGMMRSLGFDAATVEFVET